MDLIGITDRQGGPGMEATFDFLLMLALAAAEACLCGVVIAWRERT